MPRHCPSPCDWSELSQGRLKNRAKAVDTVGISLIALVFRGKAAQPDPLHMPSCVAPLPARSISDFLDSIERDAVRIGHVDGAGRILRKGDRMVDGVVRYD